MQDYFTSILRYAYHNGISINLNDAKALLKKAQALSKKQGYNVFNAAKRGTRSTEDLQGLPENIDLKDLRDLKNLLAKVFHSDILEAVFNAEKA